MASVLPGSSWWKGSQGAHWPLTGHLGRFIAFLVRNCQMRGRTSLSCGQPGWLRGSSSLPAAAPTLTHSLRVGVKFFGDLSPIIQLSNQNICIFMSLYENSFRTLQVIHSYFLENKLLEIKQLLLQMK